MQHDANRAFRHAEPLSYLAGALSLEGKMIDRPHLVQAQRIISQA